MRYCKHKKSISFKKNQNQMLTGCTLSEVRGPITEADIELELIALRSSISVQDTFHARIG